MARSKIDLAAGNRAARHAGRLPVFFLAISRRIRRVSVWRVIGSAATEKAEYQKDAIRRCYQFLDFPLKNTIVSDDTLNEKFEEAEIFKVDSNLLGSDARRIFDAAVARMDGLRDRRRAEFFLKLSETPKWSLADY